MIHRGNHPMKGGKIDILLDGDESFHGSYVDGDGCHYESEHELYQIYLLHICGCGDPASVYNFCVDALDDPSTLHRLINQHAYEASVFIANQFDKQGLISHGSSIAGAWLTKKKDLAVESTNFTDRLLLQFDKPYGINRVADLLSKDSHSAVGILTGLFRDLGLLDENNVLTSDGNWIVSCGHMVRS
jgi:hypothetical protein